MNTVNNQPPQATHTHVHVVQQSNGMGTAGFVLSLIGWVTCGVLCPVGLLFSLVGLNREPRGLAIAGTVIGGIGTLLVVGACLLFALGILGAAVSAQ